MSGCLQCMLTTPSRQPFEQDDLTTMMQADAKLQNSCVLDLLSRNFLQRLYCSEISRVVNSTCSTAEQ